MFVWVWVYVRVSTIFVATNYSIFKHDVFKDYSVKTANSTTYPATTSPNEVLEARITVESQTRQHIGTNVRLCIKCDQQSRGTGYVHPMPFVGVHHVRTRAGLVARRAVDERRERVVDRLDKVEDAVFRKDLGK